MNLLVAYKFNNNEIIGILAGVLVLVSFFFKKEEVIRMINMIGCLLFVIYGSLNDPVLPPVIGFNSVLLIVHIVYLTLGFTKKGKKQERKTIQEEYFEKFDILIKKLNDKTIKEEEKIAIKNDLNFLNVKFKNEIDNLTK